MTANPELSGLRSELMTRRARLEEARGPLAESGDVLRLLREVDAALERMKQGTYGICEVCHDPIERDRLMADPLTTVCIDHLDAPQKRALEQDLELALQIQARLLPDRPLVSDGWHVDYEYQPAGLVSGDFCDMLRAGSRRTFFTVGDVSGKGIAASMLMSHIHAMLRTLVSVEAPVESLVARANRLFATSTMPSHYATLACGFAEPDGDLAICNAGHCPPLVLRKGGIGPVEATGLPLGLFSDSEYSAERLHLEPGESVLLYSDGLTEAANRDGEEYGLERLLAVLPRCRDRMPGEISRACLEELAAFLDTERRTDDLTMMVIRRELVS